MSVAAAISSAAAAAIRSRSNSIPGSMPASASQAELDRVGGVEERLLVLLEVLAVGERQAVQDAGQRRVGGEHPRRLRPQQLGGVGVHLLGHDRGARGELLGRPAEAELARRPEHDLGADPRQVGGADGRGAEVVEGEVAVGDGVDRVLDDRRRSRARPATASRSMSQLRPARAPEPSGITRRGPLGGGEAVGIAAQHPEPGEEVMAQRDRLGPLQVGVAGQPVLAVALGHRQDLAQAAGEQLAGDRGPLGHVEGQVGGDLVVAGAAGVDLAADPADDLGQATLDRHVDVLVGGLERESRRPRARPRPGRAPSSSSSSSPSVEHAGAEQGAGVRPGLADVVGSQAPVEAQRRVQLPEDGIGFLLEARHGGSL